MTFSKMETLIIGANRLTLVWRKYWICLLWVRFNQSLAPTEKLAMKRGCRNLQQLIELIDIESLFEKDTDNKSVLSEEAWELFA